MKKTRSLYCALFLITWVVLWALCMSRRAAGAEYDCLIGTGEFAVSQNTSGDQRSPAVAFTDPYLQIAWLSSEPDFTSAISVRAIYTEDPSFTSQVEVVRTGAGALGAPSVVAWRRDVIVVWAQYTDTQTGWDIYASIVSPYRRLVGPVFRVNTTTAGDQINPRVAVSSTGVLCVVWEGTDAITGRSNIYSQNYDQSGKAIGTEAQVNRSSVGYYTDPQIAFAGSFVVVWTGITKAETGDSVAELLKRNVSGGGGAFGAETKLSSATGGRPRGPAISTWGTTYLVTWRNETADGAISYSAAVAGANEVPQVTTLTPPGPVDGGPAAVVLDADNSFVVVWNVIQSGDAGIDVMAQRYATIEPQEGCQAVGRAVAVHGNKIGDQVSDGTNCASYSGKGMTFVWTSHGQGKSYGGIFAQTFQVAPVLVAATGGALPAAESAILSGDAYSKYNINGMTPGEAWFEYGKDLRYGYSTPATVVAGKLSLRQEIKDLAPHTLYHFRLVAKGGAGTFYGSDQTLVTQNRAPVAGSDTYHFLSRSGPLSLPILLNDHDPDGDAVWLHSVVSPTNGTIAFEERGKTIEYSPGTGWDGNDRFTYEIRDDLNSRAQGVVTLVNGAPVAAADLIETPFDKASLIALLANDSDPDGDAISILDFEQPKNGSVVQLRSGLWEYRPNSGFSGVDTFQYRVTDSLRSSEPGLVTIRVAPPSAPVIRTLLRRGAMVPRADGRVPLGAEWRTFGPPVTDREGDIGFAASFSSAKGRQTGVFGSSRGAALQAIALSGEPAPGVPALEFASFRGVSVARFSADSAMNADASPALAFTATVRARDNGQWGRQGIWTTAGGDGSLKLVLLAGSPPRGRGLPETEVRAIHSFALSGNSLWAVVSLKRGLGGVAASNDAALVRWDGQEVSVALRKGAQVYDGNERCHVTAIIDVTIVEGASEAKWWTARDVVCRVRLSSGRVALIGIGRLLAITEQPVGAALPSAQWIRFGAPAGFRTTMRGDSTLAFAGTVELGSGRSPERRAQVIYQPTESGGALSGKVLAMSGELVPGRADIVFRSFGDPVAVDGGGFAFLADVSGMPVNKAARRTMLFSTTGSTLKALASEEDDLSELPGIKVSRLTGFALPPCELDGAVAAPVLEGTLASRIAAKEAAAQRAIWTLDQSGRQRLVLREGMSMGFGASARTVRTFSGLGRPGLIGPHGEATLDAHRHFVSRATFSDGSQELLRVTLP